MIDCRRLVGFLVACTCCVSVSSYAAEAERIEDLLQQRWFEIEIIIFERLDVLDANTSESLTLTTPRAWPQNLLEFYDFGPPLTALADPLTAPSRFCLGFPVLPYPDPVHPSLLPTELVLPNSDPDSDSDSDNEDEDEDEIILGEQDAFASEEDSQETKDVPLNAPQVITPYLRLLADVAEFEQGLYASSYRWLEDLTLVSEVKAINRQSKLRPLIHRRWRQPVPARDSPQPVYLSSDSDDASPLTREGFAKLEGHVAVTVGRYLHFAPTLWYHADNLGLAPIPLPVASHQLATVNNGAFMQLDESRRVRSGDLHYLDHPKLGIIVRIDPIAIPQPLLDAWQKLDEVDQDGFQ